MPNAASYSTRLAVFPQDKAAVIGLWLSNLGTPEHAPDKFRWFYEESPLGKPLTLLLQCAHDRTQETVELAGVASAGTRSFVIRGEVVTAGVLVDMTVTSGHRTLFPALKLQKAVREAGLAACRLLYGFPNAKAAPVFQRVGYRKLGMIHRYVRVLRTTRYLQRYLPSSLAAVAGAVVDAFLRLKTLACARASTDTRLRWLELSEMRIEPTSSLTPAAVEIIRGVRDESFLRWRFGESRGRRIRFISVERRDGTQAGWWIAENLADSLHVHDCSFSLTAGKEARHAWARLAAEAQAMGSSALSFECLGPESVIETLRLAGLVVRGGRPVFAAVRNEGDASAAWFLTGADEDE